MRVKYLSNYVYVELIQKFTELNFETLGTHTFLIDVSQLNQELMKEIPQTKEFKQQTSAMYLNHLHMHLFM